MPAASELTTKELQDFLLRVNLEKQYNAIVNPPAQEKKKSAARKFVEDVLVNSAKTVATKWVTDALTNIVYKNQNKDKNNQQNQQKDNTKERLDSMDKLLKDIQSKINNPTPQTTQSSSKNSKPNSNSNYWMNDSKAINETLDALLEEAKRK